MLTHAVLVEYCTFGDESGFPQLRDSAVESQTVTAAEKRECRLAGNFLLQRPHILTRKIRRIADDYIYIIKAFAAFARENISLYDIDIRAVEFCVFAQISERLVRYFHSRDIRFGNLFLSVTAIQPLPEHRSAITGASSFFSLQ